MPVLAFGSGFVNLSRARKCGGFSDGWLFSRVDSLGTPD
jgi:hypothetical protein